jgi:hypothetical protein
MNSTNVLTFHHYCTSCGTFGADTNALTSMHYLVASLLHTWCMLALLVYSTIIYLDMPNSAKINMHLVYYPRPVL